MEARIEPPACIDPPVPRTASLSFSRSEPTVTREQRAPVLSSLSLRGSHRQESPSRRCVEMSVFDNIILATDSRYKVRHGRMGLRNHRQATLDARLAAALPVVR